MTSQVDVCEAIVDVLDSKGFFNKFEHVFNKCIYFCKHLVVSKLLLGMCCYTYTHMHIRLDLGF